MSVFLRRIGVDVSRFLIQNWVAPSPLGLGLEDMASAFEDNGKLFLFRLDGTVSTLFMTMMHAGLITSDGDLFWTGVMLDMGIMAPLGS